MNIKRISKTFFALAYKLRILLYQSKKHDINVNSRENILGKYDYAQYDLSQRVQKIENYNYDLSLIVPVYNASDYIEECINSLLNQKTKYKYEIICVDDGSTDDSLSILNSYDGLIKIIHQNNGGISFARNSGLNLSSGKYVGFIDNDDYVTGDYVEKLLSCAFSTNSDYVRCGYKTIDEKTGKEIEKSEYKNEILEDINSYHSSNNWLKGYVWGGCYKRSVWEDFCFPVGYWYEDMVKNMYIFNKCQKLASIQDIMYIKRRHLSNASTTVWKKENLKCLDQLILAEHLISMRGATNNLVYEATINELGEYLYKRIEFLDEETKYEAFLLACDLLEQRNISLSKEKAKLVESLLNKDYKLWKLVCKYYRWK